jgi:hypothetical protein
MGVSLPASAGLAALAGFAAVLALAAVAGFAVVVALRGAALERGSTAFAAVFLAALAALAAFETSGVGSAVDAFEGRGERLAGGMRAVSHARDHSGTSRFSASGGG